MDSEIRLWKSSEQSQSLSHLVMQLDCLRRCMPTTNPTRDPFPGHWGADIRTADGEDCNSHLSETTVGCKLCASEIDAKIVNGLQPPTLYVYPNTAGHLSVYLCHERP